MTHSSSSAAPSPPGGQGALHLPALKLSNGLALLNFALTSGFVRWAYPERHRQALVPKYCRTNSRFTRLTEDGGGRVAQGEGADLAGEAGLHGKAVQDVETVVSGEATPVPVYEEIVLGKSGAALREPGPDVLCGFCSKETPPRLFGPYRPER